MREEPQDKVDYYEFLIDFVSHEIRNPLTAVSMFARLLKEGTYGEVPDGQREVLDRILANAERIEHMLDDFLNLTRVEGSEQFIQPEDLDLRREVILPVIESLERKHLFPAGQASLFVGEASPDVRVVVDRGLLRVAYDNLFFNAVKYGREGSPIRYGWREEGGWASAWVENEGLGVRPGDLGRIFEKFVRLKDPAMPPKRGTGLGLYNVRRIIAMHGGRIWAESEYGRSFTVRFTLPLAGAGAAGPSGRGR